MRHGEKLSLCNLYWDAYRVINPASLGAIIRVEGEFITTQVGEFL